MGQLPHHPEEQPDKQPIDETQEEISLGEMLAGDDPTTASEPTVELTDIDPATGEGTDLDSGPDHSTRNKIVRWTGGAAAAAAAVGLATISFIGKHNPEANDPIPKAKPVTQETPKPTATTPDTPATTEPTPAPSNTSPTDLPNPDKTQSVPVGAPTTPAETTTSVTPSNESSMPPETQNDDSGEKTSSATDTVIPLAELEEKIDAQTKLELSESSPELAKFIDRTTVTKAMQDGTLSARAITKYFETMQRVISQPDFANIAGSIAVLNENFYSQVKDDPLTQVGAMLSENQFLFAQFANQGTARFGKDFTQLISLSPGEVQYTRDYIKDHPDSDGRINYDKSEILDAFQVTLAGKPHTVACTYIQMAPDRFGVAGEYVSWSVLDVVPDKLVASNEALTAQVGRNIIGISFGSMRVDTENIRK